MDLTGFSGVPRGRALSYLPLTPGLKRRTIFGCSVRNARSIGPLGRRSARFEEQRRQRRQRQLQRIRPAVNRLSHGLHAAPERSGELLFRSGRDDRPIDHHHVDLAAREADALHRRRADVTTEQVLGRL